MALVPIPGFCGSSYLMRARGVSAARSINLRTEATQQPAGTVLAPIPISKAPFVMYPRSGKKLFATLPASPCVGAWSNREDVYVAAGGNIYQLFNTPTGGAIPLGTTASCDLLGAVTVGSNPVTMRANNGQLLICSGGDVFLSDGLGNFYQPIISYASGTVDVAGIAVTWDSGNQFTIGGASGAPIATGDFFQIGPNRYIVATVIDATHLTLTTPAGAFSGIAYQVGQTLLKGATVAMIDGYFIVNVPNSKTFMISNLEDGSMWNALEFATKNGSTDNIAAVVELQGYLALLGDTNSTEIWQDTGAVNFPFERVTGSSMTVGADAAWSVGRMIEGSIVWLMNGDQGNGMIAQSNGGTPTRISNYAMEYAISQYSRTDDAVASTYVENGHSFYRIDFPSANLNANDPNAIGRTWEYDANTSVWAEIGVETSEDEVYGCDLGRYHVHVTWPGSVSTGAGDLAMHLVCDYKSGNVYQVSPQFLDDNGVDFPVMRIAPHINSNLENTTCNRFAIDCDLGTIDPSILGLDGKPQIATVSMYYSDDGGHTWQDGGAASIGRSGEYQGTFLDFAELTDANPNSQTHPQAFQAIPQWDQPGWFWISKTFKIVSTGKMLRALYNGLVDIGPFPAAPAAK